MAVLVDDLELEEHRMALRHEAVHTVDLLDAARGVTGHFSAAQVVKPSIARRHNPYVAGHR